MKRLSAALAIVLILASCSKSPDKQPQSGAPGDYLAKVGPDIITEKDVAKRLEAIPEYARPMYEDEEGLRRALDEIIKTELLYLEAKEEGLDRDPEYLAKVEDYKKFALVNMLFEKVVASKPAVTEKDAQKYYNENKEKFALEQVRASHILVNTKEEAEALKKELDAGKSFEALARAKSRDEKSAEKGGDLGFFKKGEMVPEFESVAFGLKKGEISDPVQTQFGYHIIKLTDRKTGSTVEFAKVKDILMQKLDQDSQRQAFESYLDKIRSRYPVEINEEQLSKFTAKSQKPEGGGK